MGSARAFRFLWGFDAVIAAIVVFFFIWGLADGTVSSFNIMLWLAMLGGVGGIVGGSLALHRAGRTRAALGLLLPLALPGLLAVVFFVAVIVLHPRWN